MYVKPNDLEITIDDKSSWKFHIGRPHLKATEASATGTVPSLGISQIQYHIGKTTKDDSVVLYIYASQGPDVLIETLNHEKVCASVSFNFQY